MQTRETATGEVHATWDDWAGRVTIRVEREPGKIDLPRYETLTLTSEEATALVRAIKAEMK